MSTCPPTGAELLAGGFFPGPRSENEAAARAELSAVLDHWFQWRRRTAAEDPGFAAGSALDRSVLEAEQSRLSDGAAELCHRLTAEIATHTPHYIGHMKAELSLPALVGWFAAMLHNPNNTSRESSRVGAEIEAEAIAMLAHMIGYDPQKAQGHFTSGGTVANFEGMWRARYRLDHWLALALHVAEITGERMDPFAAAHMGWRRFADLAARYEVTDAQLRSCSAVAGNPCDVQRRISKAAGRDYMGPVVLVAGNRHYSWQKAANVFGMGEESFWSIALDAEGRVDLDEFERLVLLARADGRPVLMTVSVAGTTEAGEIDPIDRLHDLLDAWDRDRGWRIWSHVDAAYGGFLCSLLGGPGESSLSPASKRALTAIRRADSVTLDPHKLGYVPYACGAFLVRDRERYAVSAFAAPYLDRPELGDGKWSSTLEGSRSAAGAAATWLTGRAIGFGPERFGELLAETIRSRGAVQAALSAVPGIRVLEPADSNILLFTMALDGEASSASNERTLALFDSIAATSPFVVSKTVLGPDYGELCRRHACGYGGTHDAAGLVAIRCVFMNPYWCVPAIREELAPRFVQGVRCAAAAAAEPFLDRPGAAAGKSPPRLEPTLGEPVMAVQASWPPRVEPVATTPAVRRAGSA